MDINLDEAIKHDSLQAARATQRLQEHGATFNQRALEATLTLGLATEDDAQQYASLNAADRTPVIKVAK